MASLPISRLVGVEVDLSPSTPPSTGRDCLLLSNSTNNPISASEGYRRYTNAADVGTDFGLTSAEYSSACLWFAQRPQPNSLLIGGYTVNAIPPHIVGAQVTDLISLNVITSSNFNVVVGSDEVYVRGVNLSNCQDFASVASALTTNDFSLTYADQAFVLSPTNPSSDIGFLTLPRERIAFTGNLNVYSYGVLTPIVFTIGPSSFANSQLVLSASVNTDLIGSTLLATLSNLVNHLSSSTDQYFSLYDYSADHHSETEGYLNIQVRGT